MTGLRPSFYFSMVILKVTTVKNLFQTIGTDISNLLSSRVSVNDIEHVIENVLMKESNLSRVREYVQNKLTGRYVYVQTYLDKGHDIDTAIAMAITEAASMKRFAVLPAGEFKLSRQIYIGKQHSGIQGLIGAGMGITKLVFDWPQTTLYDWNPNTNDKDARPVQGVLVENIDDVEVKQFSIEYKGEFYRKGRTYFGSISCVMFSDTNYCSAEFIEASGANRAGIRFASHNAKVKEENTQFYNGTLTAEHLDEHSVRPNTNTAFACYTHHNRVAGVMFENQNRGLAINCISEYNGHKDDGGTGYGLVCSSGSVNLNMRFLSNVTKHNYRKGLDTHDSVDLEVTGNISYGDRLFGVALECRGFPARRHEVRNNLITFDPDHIMTWSDYMAEGALPNLNNTKDYWSYTGIRYEHNPQRQAWGDNIKKPVVIIENNRIERINQRADIPRNSHVGIEVRQNEPRGDVFLDVTIRKNSIQAGRIGQGIYVVSHENTPQGFGEVIIEENNVDIGTVLNAPFDIEEKHMMVGPFAVDKTVLLNNNRLITRENTGAPEKIAKLQSSAKQIKFTNNVIDIYGNFGRALIRLIDNKTEAICTFTGNRFTSTANQSAFWVANTGTDYINKDFAKATKFVRGNNTYGRHLAIADTQDDLAI